MDILDECRSHGVPHLDRVRVNVIRSGQSTAEGWDYLRTLLDGRRVTVIKLNFPDEGSDEPAAALGWRVLNLGIEPRTNPHNAVELVNEIIEKPDAGNWAAVMAEISNIPEEDDGRTWLIHCVNGNDRTGLACGHVRVMVDHWSKASAYEEMVRMGFHPELIGLKRQWNDLPEMYNG